MRTTTKRTVAAVLGTALIYSMTTAQAATPVDVRWSPTIVLSGPGQDTRMPVSAASTDTGVLTVAWKALVGTTDMVQTRTSTDGGATWQPARTISEPGRQTTSLTIAGSADGTRLVCAWRSFDGSSYRLRTAWSDDGGGNWSEPRDVSDAGQNADQPVLVASTDGTRVTALWRRSDGTHRRIETASSDNGGATWSIPRTLSEAGQHAEAPAVAASADGTRVAAVWYRSDGTLQRAQAAYSPNGGATWSLPTTVSDAGDDARWPQVTSSADGSRLTMVWEGFDGLIENTRSASSADGGLTWSSPVTISAGQSARESTIASSSDGSRLVAAWSGSEGSYFRIRSAHSIDAGLTWSSPVTLSADGRDGRYPRLAASHDGSRVSAVWRRSDGTRDRIEAASTADGGQSWTEPAILSPAEGGNSGGQQVRTSADGTRTFATWARNDGADFLTEVSTGSLSTTPGAPTAVAAKPKPGKAKVSWTPPGDDGNSPITQFTAIAEPGGQGCTTTGTACTISGLSNRTTYTVTVTATNALGTGPDSTPVQVTPAPKAVAIAKPVAGRSKLKVRIKPDLGPRKQWTFTVKKRVSGVWTTLRTKDGTVKVYKTRGPKHIRVLNLPKGRYKARSRAARGYLPDNSTVVKLKR